MEEKKQQPAKRVDIVQVKLVREKTMLYKNRRIRSPHDAYELMKEFLGDVDREHFVVLCLETKNQPTCIQTVHIGSLNSSVVHPREVLKPAILSEDIAVTKRLVEAGDIIGIEVIDHVILCEDSYRSLKESGYI